MADKTPPRFDQSHRLPYCRNDDIEAAPAAAFIQITGALGNMPVATGYKAVRTGIAHRVAITLGEIASGGRGPVRHEGDAWLRITLQPGERVATGQNDGGRVGVKAGSWYGVPDICGIAWIRRLHDPDGAETTNYENSGAEAVTVEALVTLDHERADSIVFKDKNSGMRGMMKALHCGIGVNATKIRDGVYQIDIDDETVSAWASRAAL